MSAPGHNSGQAKAVMERIIRLHEEVDALKEDIREVYAEAKASGFDKTALGAAVTRIRKREAGKLSEIEQQEIERDLLIAAYDDKAAP